MPVYNSKSTEAKSLKGVHLYHFVLSNCSQRVRIALCEKGVDWISHHLDLSKNEHITPEYQALNPKGVVPTLVYDGVVVVDSNDIICYLNDKFPEPPLIPESESDRVFMESFIKLASETQDYVKVLSFDLIFRNLVKMEQGDIEHLEKNRNNDEVLQFMADFKEDGEAWSFRVKEARSKVENFLERINRGLGDKSWLSGSSYGLADISWIVNIHRLKIAGFDLSDYPQMADWYERCTKRSSFVDAVSNYVP